MPPHAVGENTGKRALEGALGWGRCVPGSRNGRPEAGWRAGSEFEKGRSAASQGVKSASAALAGVHEPLEARPGERGCRTGPQKHPLGTPIHNGDLGEPGVGTWSFSYIVPPLFRGIEMQHRVVLEDPNAPGTMLTSNLLTLTYGE